MRSTVRIPIAVLSDAGAAVASDPINVDSNPLEFQIVLAAAALVDLEGSLDGVTWVNLNDDNVAGVYTITAIAAVAAGYHRVHERPKYVRMLVNIDAGGPRIFYAVLIVKERPE